MLKRTISPLIAQRLRDYPAVALVGPRQSGKTTLARQLGKRYYDLEQESDRLRLDVQWDEVVREPGLLVLDEAQEWPEVFARLRGEIDRDRQRAGRFLLLGSVSPALMTRVSESLAGRLSVVELAPLAWDELNSNAQRHRHWLMGGFPDGGVLNGRTFPAWQRDYLDLLRQRDLPNWGLAATPQTMLRLLRMLASVHGQEWNASQIGNSLGLSYHTVNSHVDYLVGAFLLRRLEAFHANIRKRLVKRPKVYWRDTGLLHSILNVEDADSLLSQPWVGASWEGYVIQQVISALEVKGAVHYAFYLRTSDQREIDLILELAGERWAIEIKLTSRPSRDDLASLNRNADLIEADRRFLVCRQSDLVQSGGQTVCDLEGMLECLP
ncbi:MAG: ATP-binding protein [Gammaproteobacteria bacterium]|nr:ATP-binding protein [Gammaproteobacteria bacterium]